MNSRHLWVLEVLLWSNGGNYRVWEDRGRTSLLAGAWRGHCKETWSSRLAEHESLRFQDKTMKRGMCMCMCGWSGVCTIGITWPSFSSRSLVYPMAQGSSLSYNVPFIGKLWSCFSVDGLLGGPSWGCPGEKPRPWGR